MVCPKCAVEKPQEGFKNGVCADCSSLERDRELQLQRNVNWIDFAEDNGIALYERQPGETDKDYGLWVIYRDMYPTEKPSLAKAAERHGVSYSTFKKASAKWSFAARMQAWIQHTDELLLNERRNDIISMNEQHMSMAMRLNAKISQAIDGLDPQYLAPKDINGLMKTAAELERKAKMDQMEIIAAGNPNSGNDENPNLRKTDVKTSDIGEILGILGKAGVMGDFGVKQTTTTEVVVKGGE